MLSFWERESFIRYDYVIIGGGIVGLSTALTLKERQPNSSVLVLERGLLPAGASTKSAGFAGFGSLTEVLAGIRDHGEKLAVGLVEQRLRGLGILRQRLGDGAMRYEQLGGYELVLEKHVGALAELERANLMLRPIFKSDAFRLANDKIAEFGFSPGHVRALVHSPFEGQLDVGKLMRSLLDLALTKDVVYLANAEARHIEAQGSLVEVAVEHNRTHTPKQILFQTRKVILCANAFISRFVHDIDIKPGRGQVFVTRPIEGGVPFQGVFHADEGYFYFRNVQSPEGTRILVGGGRNLSFETETSTEFALTYSIQQYLENFLHVIVAPGIEAKVEKRWTGIMGFSSNKLPIVKRINEHLFVGFGCNGMGITLGSVVGERTAQLALEE